MVRRGEKAFTVAELLVTIAIIAVLAAMVVPVFEARSEEARSLTCQSNMQRIVTAIRMYMADHDDTMPPDEHRIEVITYFQTVPGGHPSRSYTVGDLDDRCNRDTQANPYLRYPVLLDSYVASRSVWQCPSATIASGATWIVPGPDWLGHLQAYEGMWGRSQEGGGPCYWAWPTGWGGEVTDSIMQEQLAVYEFAPLYGTVASGAFIQSIGTTWWPDLTLGEVADASKFIIAGDGGVQTQDLGVGVMAYPEICALECSGICGWADWNICADSAADCGLYRMAPNDGSFVRYPSLRMPYARHRARFTGSVPLWKRNGINVGFLDGHVAFMASEDIISEAGAGEFEGVKFWGPTSADDTWHWEECWPDGVLLF